MFYYYLYIELELELSQTHVIQKPKFSKRMRQRRQKYHKKALGTRIQNIQGRSPGKKMVEYASMMKPNLHKVCFIHFQKVIEIAVQLLRQIY